MKNVLLLLIVVAAMLIAYQAQVYLKKKLRPQESFQRLSIFFLLIITLIFLLVFVTGFSIIYFKDFFFK